MILLPSRALRSVSLFSMFLGVVGLNQALAQCSESESALVVEVTTDGYPGEISWEVVMGGEVVLSGGPYAEGGTMYADTLCFPSSDEPCIQFEIFDSFGDGIFDPGGYNV